jgi:hypothetical protein
LFRDLSNKIHYPFFVFLVLSEQVKEARRYDCVRMYRTVLVPYHVPGTR